MHRNQSVNVHQFSMVPRADIPRSGFKIESSYKTTLDSGVLVPVYVEEVLPGDSFNLSATMFARLATPIVPIIDNLYLDTFYFFVPNRLLWDNWQKFMGERTQPLSSIDYTLPTVSSPSGGWAEASLGDYFGLPTAGQIGAGATIATNALPFRAYNLIWNEWFRDQNLQNPRRSIPATRLSRIPTTACCGAVSVTITSRPACLGSRRATLSPSRSAPRRRSVPRRRLSLPGHKPPCTLPGPPAPQ